MNKPLNPHGVSAIVQQGDDVEVRYSDGKEPVLVVGSTTSKVLKQIQTLKMRENPDARTI